MSSKVTAKKIEQPDVVYAVEALASRILFIRGIKVMVDTDLAELYGVETKTLNQAVKRNIDRFPADFMFQLSWEEAENFRSQTVTLNQSATSPSRSQTVTLKRGGNVKYQPYVFTEQGVAMLSSVLKSPRAIAVNIEIMRAFVKLREMLVGNKELAAKCHELEHKLETHDQAIAGILNAIRELMKPPEIKKRPIGFITPQDKKKG